MAEAPHHFDEVEHWGDDTPELVDEAKRVAFKPDMEDQRTIFYLQKILDVERVRQDIGMAMPESKPGTYVQAEVIEGLSDAQRLLKAAAAIMRDPLNEKNHGSEIVGLLGPLVESFGYTVTKDKGK